MISHLNDKPKYLIEEVIKNRPILVRQAHKLFHNLAYAEDAAQDALVSALSHLDNFRGDSQVSTWLYKVGTNAALMNIRRMKRAKDHTQRAMIDSPISGYWLHGNTSLQGPQSALEGTQQQHILHQAVAQLPEHYRKVVALCDLNEQPIDQVAASLGLTVGGVRTRRLRAHRMLRKNALLQNAL